MCLLVLAPALVLAQTNAQNAPSDPTSVAAELKALREAMAQQQQQLAQQQQRIDTLEKELEAKTAGTPHVEDAALHTSTPATTNAVASDVQEKVPESPLSFRIGGADFTPGGFVDFENIFRSTNTTNSAATSFGAIPFSNTVQGHLTEFRSTGQYSRLNLTVKTKFGANNVTGYVEGDFNGNSAGNVFVGTNPHTARLRLYWLDLKRGKWEFLGGQSWGLMTPNRVGLSPMPADLALGYGEDANVHVGINHTRASQFRAVWHPSDRFAWGVAVENPQQFVGNSVVVPNLFAAQLTNQFDVNSATGQSGIPNLAPDVNTKMAWDSDPGGHHFHAEVGGMLTTVKATVIPRLGPTFTSHTKVGGGAQGAFNFELFKNFRIIANGMWGNGIGRYLIGLAPQVVVAPVTPSGGTACTSTTVTPPPPATSFISVSGNCDIALSLVHSGNGTAGLEWQPVPKTQFGFYYGGLYAQRNFFPDLTGGTNSLGNHPFIGFGWPSVPAAGIPGSPNNHNRAIQQGTIDWTQTFWRNPQYGAVLLVTQTSYLTRAPWFVAAGAPKNAHLTMGFLSLRYVLP
jgi:hypothetical protein